MLETEIIMGSGRWTASEKLRIVKKLLVDDFNISAAGRGTTLHQTYCIVGVI